MRGPRPTPCVFPDSFLQEARETIRRCTAARCDVQRWHLVLLLHEHSDLSPDDAATLVGLSARQIQRWRRRWVAGDFSIEDETGRGRKPTFSPAGPRPGASDGL